MVDPEFVKLCHGQISHENAVCILFDSSKSINIEIVKFPVEVRSGYDHNFVIWPSNLAATISLFLVSFKIEYCNSFIAIKRFIFTKKDKLQLL